MSKKLIKFAKKLPTNKKSFDLDKNFIISRREKILNELKTLKRLEFDCMRNHTEF